MIVAIAGLWPALGSSPDMPVLMNCSKDNTGSERTGRKPPAALWLSTL